MVIAPGEIKILKENEPVQVLPTNSDGDYLVVFKESTFGVISQINTKGVFFNVASESFALKGGPPKRPLLRAPIGAPKPLQVPRPVAPTFRPVNEAAVKSVLIILFILSITIIFCK